MEPEQPSQAQEPQPQQVWRAEPGPTQTLEAKKRKHIIGKIQTKFPKHSMDAKANMLSDLLSRFKPSTGEHHGDCCEGHIKDRFHFVKKDIKAKKKYRGVSRKRMKHFQKVKDLVSQMNSPSFAIQPDPSEFDINRGILTFSFFDKTPREPLPQVNITEENSEESRPDVTKKFENCSIDSGSHRISALMDCHEQ